MVRGALIGIGRIHNRAMGHLLEGALIGIGALINKTTLKGERLLERGRLLEGGC